MWWLVGAFGVGVRCGAGFLPLRGGGGAAFALAPVGV